MVGQPAPVVCPFAGSSATRPAGLLFSATLFVVLCAAPAPTARADGAHGHKHGGTGQHETPQDGTGQDRDRFDGVEFRHDLEDKVRTFEVAAGAHVRLVLSAPGPVEVHLHGYDIVARGDAGAPVVIVFRAVHAGRFPLVLHKDDDLLGRAETAVAYVEVRPR